MALKTEQRGGGAARRKRRRRKRVRKWRMCGTHRDGMKTEKARARIARTKAA